MKSHEKLPRQFPHIIKVANVVVKIYRGKTRGYDLFRSFTPRRQARAQSVREFRGSAVTRARGRNTDRPRSGQRRH